MKALVYDLESGGLLGFENPVKVLVARDISEVVPVLEEVESRTAAGCFSVGYVSYEAAPAFDAGLVCGDPGGKPYAVFGVFDTAVNADLGTITTSRLNLEPVISEPAFGDAIDRIKQYLREGDSYQVNFTHRLKGRVDRDLLETFLQLFSSQPSHYAAYLALEETTICSLSPELFFEKQGNAIRTEPMKGTRPRGVSETEDRDLKESLESSAKDRAENLMIVDMIRNDLGRIAQPGSVRVEEMFRIRKLPTVWQQVSSVTAQSSAGLADVFAALFPCASVTGAPKHRTMEIIYELEDSSRGVYTGAVGLVKPGGDARFNVAIRTLEIDNRTGDATYGVGGGIVWDSDATEEWQESLVKAEILNRQLPEFSLLETLKYEAGKGIWLLDRHLQRLRASADYFDYPFDEAKTGSLLAGLEADHDLRVRLLLSRDGKITIEEIALGEIATNMTLKLAESPVNSRDVFLFHKTTHRDVYTSRKLEGCDDVILYNEMNELTETTIANLVLEVDGELLTPCLAAGLLAGTCRQELIESGKVRESRLMVEDLARASRILIANSLRGLVPATLVD